MARQNLHVLKASLGWRELEPGAYTLEKSAAFEVTQNRNLSGLDLGQLYELNGRLKLRNFSSVLLAADVAPARFDDREVGNGTALERGALRRRALRARQRSARAASTRRSPTRRSSSAPAAYATSAQGSLIVHALRQLDIELLPQLTWSAGEYPLRAPGRGHRRTSTSAS